MKRNKFLIIVSVVALAAASLGWFLGKKIQSPEEKAAAAGMPEPSLLTVSVKAQELNQKVVLRGTASSNNSVELTPSVADGSEAVITGMLKEAGDSVSEGEVIVEVSGRPVFVLQGDLPAFRSFTPGLRGPDVQQLEESLERLGYRPGAVDEVYDSSTAAAVESLYKSKGYRANQPSAEEKESLRSAEEFVRQSEQALKALQDPSSEGSAGLSETQKLQLSQSVEQAKDSVAAAEREAQIAKSEATAAKKVAVGEVSKALEIFNESQDAESKRILEEARFAANIAKEQEQNVFATQDSLIKDARLSLQIAETDRAEQLNTTADVSSTQEEIEAAKKNLTAAEESLADLTSSVGVSFPTAEVIFIRNLPQEVTVASGKIGDIVSGPALTISGSETLITSSVSSTDRKLLKTGLSVLLEQPELDFSMQATITEVASAAGGGDISANRFAVVITPDGVIPPEVMGQNLRVTVPVSASDGEVLVVPLAAVSATADGKSRVDVETSPGKVKTVEVISGLTADGVVEVRSVNDSLSVGDRVVVGNDVDLSDVLGNSSGSDSA